MGALTAFGLFVFAFMLISYILEGRAPVRTLLVALGGPMVSANGFAQGDKPFDALEPIWSGVALRQWARPEEPLA